MSVALIQTTTLQNFRMSHNGNFYFLTHCILTLKRTGLSLIRA
ncbi:hypothetical protein THOG11_180123 [Vibrio harveyi]|nr:hypothetical protein VHARVF571_250133 [Vibrio harveyi]CAH1560196.1 hypothetical protein THOG11_180123 [Vibrio harveyi]